MFANRVVAFFYFIFSLTLLAAANPWNEPVTTTITVTQTASNPEPSSSCTAGPISCCQSLQTPTDPEAAQILGALDIVVQGIDVLLGLTCSPINVVGVGQSTCTENVVCCQNNNVGGLISIGCIPIIL